jgi:hypothetical protein
VVISILCKICDREKPAAKDFVHAPKQHICDECIELMGYDYQKMGERIHQHFMKEFGTRVADEVQRTLPQVIEKLMVESGIEFELKVI